MIFAAVCLTPPVRAGEEQIDAPPSAAVSPAAKKTPDGSYVLQPGDKLNIKIYPEDEYIKGGRVEIGSEGNITLPLVGKIQVAGKNVLEAERAIVKMLAVDYLVDPEAVIEVLEYRKQSIVVLGQVRKPGTYQFPEGAMRMTLLEAVSMAGGFSDVANAKRIKIIRKKDRGNEMIQANAEAIMAGKEKDVELESGDIVNVSESLF